MSDINNISFTGRLTADAELKQFPSGKKFAKFSVATNTGFGDYAKTTFFDCILIGDQRAEKLTQYLVKGKQVAISGTIEKNDYTDKNGVLHKAMQVTVDQLALMSDGKGGSNKGTGEQDLGYEVVTDDELKRQANNIYKSAKKNREVF